MPESMTPLVAVGVIGALFILLLSLLTNNYSPHDRRIRCRQDGVLPVSKSQICLRQRYELSGVGYQRRCDTLQHKECLANTLKLAAQKCEELFNRIRW